MERLRNVLQIKVEEVHARKVKLTESRIKKGEKPEEIHHCNQTIEAEMEGVGQTVNELDGAIKEAKQREMRQSKRSDGNEETTV